MRVLVAVMVVWALLPAVAGPAVAQPPAPVPVPETAPGTPAAMFVDDPSIVHAYPTRPQAWSRVVDERMVRLHFTTGTPECYGVTTTVQETADESTGITKREVIDWQPLGARSVLSVT